MSVFKIAFGVCIGMVFASILWLLLFLMVNKAAEDRAIIDSLNAGYSISGG
ncbi:MAG TPA: hypothetical protein VD794_12935 [Flavisolibacter sp.]|nr:hypothetical protein [Flavisolibacter sp.]